MKNLIKLKIIFAVDVVNIAIDEDENPDLWCGRIANLCIVVIYSTLVAG
jgi:hypothetical protein